MVFRNLFTTCLLAAGFTFTAAGIAFAGETKGYLEHVTEDGISGWACDSQQPDASIPVQVIVTDPATNQIVFSAAGQADAYRTDLEEQGFGNGKHVFTIPVDWSALGQGAYTVKAFAGSSQLNNSISYRIGDADGAVLPEPKLIPMGVFRITGYCPCRSCSEGWGRRTSSGAVATANHTIAVDPRVIPMGTKVMINGIVYTAEDRGGGVKGRHIDIFYNNHAEIWANAVSRAEVYLVR